MPSLTRVILPLAAPTILSAPSAGDPPIRVVNPTTIRTSTLPARRIPAGITGDYKPNTVLLPTGELLMTMFQPHNLPGGEYQEDIILYRSRDGGLTWGDREVPSILGREPYLTCLADGTLFITVHFLVQDHRNTLGYVPSFLHRSTDGGRTWTSRMITREDLPGAPAAEALVTSRNVLELPDGTLILGVSAEHGVDALWRSRDHGVTWDSSLTPKFEGMDAKQNPYQSFGETMFWRGTHHLFAILRVDPRFLPLDVPGGLPPAEVGDEGDRLIAFRSPDDGRTWTAPQALGGHGMMYPSILRLPDDRLLLTFTRRALEPPLGVQAVLGHEDDRGLHFDLDHDRLVLDAKTPEGLTSGGGFGNTLRLPNGALITPYSYRDAQDQTHVEVLRWRLPRTEAVAVPPPLWACPDLS